MSAIATLVERHSRSTTLVSAPGAHAAAAVANALAAKVSELPVELRCSPWDHGKEMVQHAGSVWRWECPSTSAIPEHMAGTARARTPTAFYSHDHLDAAAYLNGRPRQTLE